MQCNGLNLDFDLCNCNIKLENLVLDLSQEPSGGRNSHLEGLTVGTVSGQLTSWFGFDLITLIILSRLCFGYYNKEVQIWLKYSLVDGIE